MYGEYPQLSNKTFGLSDLTNSIFNTLSVTNTVDTLGLGQSQLREFAAVMGKLKLERGELQEITTEIGRLSSVEDLRLAAQNASSVIEEEESGSLTTLGITRKSLDSVRAKDPQIEELYQRVSEAFFLVDDAKGVLASYIANLEADPARLDYLNARKAEINSLIKKYGGSQPGDDELIALIERFESSKNAIADLEGGDERLKELEQHLSGQLRQQNLPASTIMQMLFRLVSACMIKLFV